MALSWKRRTRWLVAGGAAGLASALSAGVAFAATSGPTVTNSAGQMMSPSQADAMMSAMASVLPPGDQSQFRASEATMIKLMADAHMSSTAGSSAMIGMGPMMAGGSAKGAGGS